MFETVFRRYELKYLISREMREKLMPSIMEHMHPDRFGKTTIRNLYFDTEDYLLIRRSLERGVFKEKLRLRSYRKVDAEDTVFAELKRKYEGVVYKRRLALAETEAMTWLATGKGQMPPSQISREIDYFLGQYQTLRPVVFLAYDREAYYSDEDHSFRITFDENALARADELSLTSDVYGTPLLDEDTVLMEIKCSGGIPLWMVRELSENGIRKTPFSKYGTAYRTIIFETLQRSAR